MGTISHIWTRVHVKWLIEGALCGILAGTVMMLIGMFLALKTSGDWTQPLKLVGATVYGPRATAYGPLGAAGLVGGVIHYSLCVLYGVVFTHLVDEESRSQSLIVLALVTSFIIWIFGFLLFMPSFNLSLAYGLSAPMSLLLHLTFGFFFSLFLIWFRPFFVK